MSEGERLHYSARHWEKQFNDCIHASTLYEDRVHRDEISSEDRAEEVKASARDRIFYAHVNRRAMGYDPLRINDTAFGRMLDDTKKNLREIIDLKFKTIGFQFKLEWLVDDYLTLVSERPKPTHPPGIGPYQSARRAGKTSGAERQEIQHLEKGEGVLDYYDAIAQYRERSGYYDSRLKKFWKKVKQLFNQKYK